ncbi:hypothetical protein [Massilia sp. Mn16-1_5]|uniref:hypothetical protein n=1 Tax=Massilia sp. Mn16-1_5 TaxID=2079199 RepID=UPI00109E6BF1|nr:hypothetical protein [Massilia sp. Mn16-1_5]THC40952.1 hypothetical protein C2862_20045 [Massilia sp. Mn16-1_5]
MIRSPLRAGIALACALSLSACGGGDGDVYVGGSITGYTKAGLVLTNNDGPRYEVPLGTSFIFPELVETDATYNVKVVASPDNTTGCQVVEGTGTGKAVFSISSVQIACTLKTFPLTVRVNGTHAAGLAIVNGSDRQDVAPDATVVQMKQIPEGAVYGVAVLAAPGQTCTVANGSGTMDNVGKTVDLNCTTP